MCYCLVIEVLSHQVFANLYSIRNIIATGRHGDVVDAKVVLLGCRSCLQILACVVAVADRYVNHRA